MEPRISSFIGKRAYLIPCLFLAASMFSVYQANAQDVRSSELLDYYMKSRSLRLSNRISRAAQYRLTYRAPEGIPSKNDSLRAWIDEIQYEELKASLPPVLETFSVQSWDVISRLRAASFRDQFARTQWAFTGSNSRAPLDTMKTADLRARFESEFGPPTMTLAEIGYPDSLAKEQIIEFEYWFVLNDSINVIVMDVNGPWDRGMVLAADRGFRSELKVIKNTFLEQLVLDSERKPFTDYYFNYDQQAWYLTGYDGASFFDERIVRPDLELGRPAIRHSEQGSPQEDDSVDINQ